MGKGRVVAGNWETTSKGRPHDCVAPVGYVVLSGNSAFRPRVCPAGSLPSNTGRCRDENTSPGIIKWDTAKRASLGS